MKRLFRLECAAVLAIALLAVCLSAVFPSLAWLGGTNSRAVGVTAGVFTGYFEHGTGTSSDPYVIHTPKHLYNLAWLQYMGRFDSSGLHFALCTENICNEHTGISDDGLNMQGWTLPPIGTESHPFVGTFEGNGKTITNLEVTNDVSSIANAPASANTPGIYLGVFGYINGGSVSNVNLNQITVSAASGTTATAGIAVGYVNGPISGIGVANSNLSIGTGVTATGLTSNISDYSLVGYCDPAYRGKAGVANRTLNGPTESSPPIKSIHAAEAGLGSAWGNSIAMETMYTNLANMKNNAVRNPIASEYVTVIQSGSGDNVTSTFERGSGTLGNRNGYNLVHYYGDNGGVSATFVNRTDTNNYMYLTEAANIFKTVTTNTLEESNEVVISDATGHFLGIAADGSVIVTDHASARGWLPNSVNSFYYQDEATNTTYYLNCDENGDLYVSNAQLTVWTIGKDTVSCILNGERKYLYCDTEQNQWTVVPRVQKYFITDGENNFLSVDPNNDAEVTNDTNASTATTWDTREGSIRVNVNGSTRYLHFDVSANKLVLTTDAQHTEWINDGASIYCMVNGLPYYLTFDNGVWNAERPKDAVRKIFSGNQYLVIDANGNLAKSTNAANATQWHFAYDSGKYLIYGTKPNDADETLYYLTTTEWRTGNTVTVDTTKDNPLTLELTTNPSQAVNWNWDEEAVFNESTNTLSLNGSIYYAKDYMDSGIALNRYLELATGNNGQWRVNVAKVYYTISKMGNDSVRHYLSYNSGLKDSLVQDDTTLWDFQNHDAIKSPSGTVKTIDGRTYLSVSGSLLRPELTTGNETNWRIVNNRLAGQYKGRFLIWEIDTAGYVRFVNTNAPTWNAALYASNPSPTVDVTPTQKPKTVALEEIQIAPPEAYSLNTDGIPAINISSAMADSGTVGNSVQQPAATTYFPLSTLGALPYAASPYNNGYVISGMNDSTSAYRADIRVSRYGIGNISTSTGSNNRYDKDTVRILACNTTTNGAFKVVSGDGSALRVGNTTYDYIGSTSFQRFADAKKNLDDLLTGKNYIYGLHFMNAKIGPNNVLTATKATINGRTYANYQLPKDCIDIKLAYRGYITLFAGTYYSGNNTFFSLYKIERDSNNTITGINEISKIYGDAANGYTYDSGSNLAFDMNWITNTVFQADKEDENGGSTVQRTRLENNALYYFEIPVEAGEYAIGSVSGMTGAYLIYLDLSANQRELYETTVTLDDTISTNIYEYPMGVDIVKSGDPIGVTPSAVVSIPANSSGNMKLERTGPHTVSYTPISGNEVSTYTAHLNTNDDNDLPVGSTLSVYGIQDDMIDYHSWNSAARITADNQHIDADVILSPDLEASPIVEITGTTTTSYYNFYSCENHGSADEKYVFIKSTADNPETSITQEIKYYNVYTSPVQDITPKTLSGDYSVSSTKAIQKIAYAPAMLASSAEESRGGPYLEDEAPALYADIDGSLNAESLQINVAPDVLEASRSVYQSYQMQPIRQEIPDYVSLVPYSDPEEEPGQSSDEELLELDKILSEIPDEAFSVICSEEYQDAILDAFIEIEPELLARICNRILLIQDESQRQEIIAYFWKLAGEKEAVNNALLTALALLPDEDAEALKRPAVFPAPDYLSDLLAIFGGDTNRVLWNDAAAVSTAVYAADVWLNGEQPVPAIGDMGLKEALNGRTVPLVYLRNDAAAISSGALIATYTIPEGSNAELAFDLGGGEIVTVSEIGAAINSPDGIHYTVSIPAVYAPALAYTTIPGTGTASNDTALGAAIMDEPSEQNIADIGGFVLVPTSQGSALRLESIRILSADGALGTLDMQEAPVLSILCQEPATLKIFLTEEGYKLITDSPDNLTIDASVAYTIEEPSEDEESTEATEESSEPEESTEATEESSEPEESTEATEESSEPEETEATEESSEPEETEATEESSEPEETTEATEESSEPEETEATEESSEPEETEATEESSEPEETTEATEESSEPEETTEATEESSEPEETEATEESSEPEESTEATEESSEPDETIEVTEESSEPEESIEVTEESSEPEETEATEESSETEETEATEESSETEETEATEESSETEETEETTEPEPTPPPVWHTLYAKHSDIYFDGYADLSTPAKALDVHSSFTVYQGMPTLRSDFRMPDDAWLAGQSIYDLWLDQTVAMIFLDTGALTAQNASITIRYTGDDLAFDRGGGEICRLTELANVQITYGDYTTAVIPATVDNMRLAAYCSIDASANIADAFTEDAYALVLVPTSKEATMKLERIELFSTDTLVGTVELRMAGSDYFAELMSIFYHQRYGESFALTMENANGRLLLSADAKDELNIFAFHDYQLLLPGDEAEEPTEESTEVTEESTAATEETTEPEDVTLMENEDATLATEESIEENVETTQATEESSEVSEETTTESIEAIEEIIEETPAVTEATEEASEEFFFEIELDLE